jgi:tetratricopeptide (TPR) repeat protein
MTSPNDEGRRAVEHELKRLPQASLEAAVAKAAHYRDLNQPDEAESICRDILDVDTSHQAAWKILGLSLTDRFDKGHVGLLEQAIGAFERLTDEYDRTYLVGVAWEREAKAHVERDEYPSAVAAFEHALGRFERAGHLRPDSPDPVLRWNRCVRMLTSHPRLREAMHRSSDGPVVLGD